VRTGVPQSSNGWDVTWLGNSAGYLHGSAFPTLPGNTVITGHVWNADDSPGIFVRVKDLQYGDQFYIYAWGQTYTYEVRANELVMANDLSAVFHPEQYDWVTLLTCENYDQNSGAYLYRRIVRAVLMRVE
jgi:large repetitive protein